MVCGEENDLEREKCRQSTNTCQITQTSQEMEDVDKTFGEVATVQSEVTHLVSWNFLPPIFDDTSIDLLILH